MGRAKRDFTTELAELQLQDAGYQMWCAPPKRALLDSVSGLSREEKLAAAAATLEQFTPRGWTTCRLSRLADRRVRRYGDRDQEAPRSESTPVEGRQKDQRGHEDTDYPGRTNT